MYDFPSPSCLPFDKNLKGSATVWFHFLYLFLWLGYLYFILACHIYNTPLTSCRHAFISTEPACKLHSLIGIQTLVLGSQKLETSFSDKQVAMHFINHEAKGC